MSADVYTTSRDWYAARQAQFAQLAAQTADPNAKAMYDTAAKQAAQKVADFSHMLTNASLYSSNDALRAQGMYRVAQQQQQAQADEFDRLFQVTQDPNAKGMYGTARDQSLGRVKEYEGLGGTINEFQVPGIQGQSQIHQRLAEIGVGEQQARQDTGMQVGRLTDQFQQKTMPQLKGALGATGQFYGTAGDKATQQAGQQFTNQTFDLNSQMQRKLDDFTRQRTYASIGMLV